jgi:hypothetical protein
MRASKRRDAKQRLPASFDNVVRDVRQVLAEQAGIRYQEAVSVTGATAREESWVADRLLATGRVTT